MKFIVSALVASALFLQVHSLPAEHQKRQERRTEDTCTCGYAAVPFLRGWSAARTDHFYTTSASQMENIVDLGIYVSQGDAAAVWTTQVPNTVPFYQLCTPTATDHFYTTSATESANAISNMGYASQGIAAYIYPSSLCGTIPLYRMYNPTTVDHFYTTNMTEKNNAITTGGYIDEGVAGACICIALVGARGRLCDVALVRSCAVVRSDMV